MQDELLLSTAYFPPAEYFNLIRNAGDIFIEREETYLKQSYRNRCKILGANGIQTLTVPVMKGNLRNAKISDVTIDYSKRWQMNHMRTLKSAYGRSPFYQYYSELFEKIIERDHKYLLDLNNELLRQCNEILDINKCINYTSYFVPVNRMLNDYRYKISPKQDSAYTTKKYIQVFGKDTFVTGLSILDLIFNTGPDSKHYF